jgi:hypothetical protein
MARIFFFTSFSVSLWRERSPRLFAVDETYTIVEFRRAFNEEPQRFGVREPAPAVPHANDPRSASARQAGNIAAVGACAS